MNKLEKLLLPLALVAVLGVFGIHGANFVRDRNPVGTVTIERSESPFYSKGKYYAYDRKGDGSIDEFVTYSRSTMSIKGVVPTRTVIGPNSEEFDYLLKEFNSQTD